MVRSYISHLTIVSIVFSACLALLAGAQPTRAEQDPHPPKRNSAQAAIPRTTTAPLQVIVAVAAGDTHTCALTSSGGVKCWGANWLGQLGDGTTVRRSTPVNVVGLNSGVTAIAAGGDHTCALTSTSGVKCWGANWTGQLGDGSNTNRTTPVDVIGLESSIDSIAAGNSHTCVLIPGGIKCWGGNASGQLGDGSTTDQATPVDVLALNSDVEVITVGGESTCALTTGGGIKCWGNNGWGQLGDGSTINHSSPVDVAGLSSNVTAITNGGAHTCALVTNGAAKCWGYNFDGQLGDDTTTDRFTPIDVVGLDSGIDAITAGGYYIYQWGGYAPSHTCALTSSGGVKCWGNNNDGQLGDGTTTGRTTPVDVAGLDSGVTAIAAGGYHTCVVTSSGGVKCWGNNSSGQLGNGSTSYQVTPVNVLFPAVYLPLIYWPPTITPIVP